MNIEFVKKLEPLEQFCYWIRERHNIFLRRRSGAPKPWTDDEVLQTTFFTNPYRENDKVTVWFRENIREYLRDKPEVLMATVIFRWFNLPHTGTVLANFRPRDRDQYEFGLLEDWNQTDALRELGAIRANGEPVFTGAYMINSPAGEPKLEAICRRIQNVWDAREELLDSITGDNVSDAPEGPCSLERAHRLLTQFDGLGGFMAYEIVCDLRYTYLLENAPDKETWCNPGPGAIRGLMRLMRRPFPKGNNSTSPPRPKDWDGRMIALLSTVQSRLPRMPHLEMREIEHSLCEYDKYLRVLNGDGRAKRTYKGK